MQWNVTDIEMMLMACVEQVNPKCLPQTERVNFKALPSFFISTIKLQVPHVYNFSTQKAEAGEL